MNMSNALQQQHSTLQSQLKYKHIGITNMKTKIISQIVLTLGLVFVLGSAITPAHGGTEQTSASAIDALDQLLPVVTIHRLITLAEEKSVPSCWARVRQSRWLQSL
jgi:hypothetical protein